MRKKEDIDALFTTIMKKHKVDENMVVELIDITKLKRVKNNPLYHKAELKMILEKYKSYGNK